MLICYLSFELNFAVNVLGTYTMTELMLPLLEKATPDAKVITVASGGMYTSPLTTDLQVINLQDTYLIFKNWLCSILELFISLLCQIITQATNDFFCSLVVKNSMEWNSTHETKESRSVKSERTRQNLFFFDFLILFVSKWLGGSDREMGW